MSRLAWPPVSVKLDVPPELLARLDEILLPPIPPGEQCLRCKWFPQRATVEVLCYLGCAHKQCEGCAELTAKEAKEDWSGGD